MRKNKYLSINNNKLESIQGKSFITKFFLINYRFFDLNNKCNGGLKNISFFPKSFNSQVSLPIYFESGNINFKVKILLNCLRIIKFFTFQKSFLKKKIIMEQVKKKNAGFVIQSRTFRLESFNRFFYYALTILPYLKLSYGFDRSKLLSDTQGNLSLAIDDITFFSHYINEKHLEWERQFFFTFSWVYKRKIKLPKRNFFFFLPFIKDLISWLLWGGLCFTCYRGHSGWLPFAKFSKTIFFNNLNFFSKNYRF